MRVVARFLDDDAEGFKAAFVDIASRFEMDWSLRPASQRRKVVALVSKRSEEHTSELQSLMRISYAVFCLKQKKITPIARRSSYPSCQVSTRHSAQLHVDI